MNISYNWLKEYIEIPDAPEALAHILTDLGLEVEGVSEVQSITGGLAGLKIGHVKTCDKHPNADRLSVTTVDIGAEKVLHIVCGAPNVAAGQKVVVAPVNTELFPTTGDPFVIKKGKIRGEVSEGMICAEDEIGLGLEHDGIIVLPEHATIGTDAASFFKIEIDTVYEIGLTPNRSDATSHIGVARDLLAYYRYHNSPDQEIKLPEAHPKIELDQGKEVKVELLDLKGCPRFSGLTLSNVKIGPSPEWMQVRLRAIGVRPLSNVVDITNYVLHEFGQPLHAYDFDKIGNSEIRVQTLDEGSQFKSLDEKERTLSAEDLIICDGNNKGMCIAGVYGGIDSGVTEATTDIFLEAAYFNPLQLRKTSTRHQLRTDAAKCFEKGTDPANTVAALKRAAALMCEYADAFISSELVDEYPNPILPKEITLRNKRVNTIIGTRITNDQIAQILKALDIEVIEHEEAYRVVKIPTNKADVTREIDVIEEILRIYGFNNVPVTSKLSTTFTTSEGIDKVRLRNIIASLLTNQGYNEMMGLSLIPSSKYDSFESYKSSLVYINNTSNVQLDVMRPEMMMSALIAGQYNLNRQQKDLSLFEMGKSYLIKEDTKEENEWITILKTGSSFANNWRYDVRPNDFYDIKRAVLSIFSRLGIENYQIDQIDDARFEFGLSYHRGPKVLASLGRVSDSMNSAADIEEPIYYAELNMEFILEAARKSKTRLKVIPKFPSSKRDLALTIEEDVTYQKVESIIRKNSGSLLKKISLFDIYRDKKQLGPGKKSYAVSLTFEDMEKNLKDKAIDKIVSKVVGKLKDEVGATLR